MLYSFLYLLLGLILGNISYVFARNRQSHCTPVKFNFVFWLRDNWIKVLNSLIIAVSLNLVFNLDVAHTTKALGFEWLPIYSVGVGLIPDTVLSFLKSKFGFLQPKNVKSKGKVYNRKEKL